MLERDTKRQYQLFATVLDYPSDSLPASAAECAERLTDSVPQAAEAMRGFVAFVEKEDLSGMEEIYTRTFDITPTTTLYVGYHLFGESYKRGAFLAKLQEAYRAHDFSRGTELPDYLCVLLRFASLAEDPEFIHPLLREAIVPALKKIEDAFQESQNGYEQAVRSLRLFLRQECQGPVEVGGLQHG